MFLGQHQNLNYFNSGISHVLYDLLFLAPEEEERAEFLLI